MKTVLRILIGIVTTLIVVTLAHAADHDRRVRVYLVTHEYETPYFTGDTIPLKLDMTLLFIDDPCPLPIAGRENMLRFWQADRIGCWYPSVNDEVVSINSIGGVHYDEGVYWQAYPLAILHPNNTVTITETQFDSRKFFIDVIGEIRLDQARKVIARQAP